MFRQEFEMETDCKRVNTMFRRFERKYPEAWAVWGEMFEHMAENGKEHEEDKENGWCLWLYIDEQFGTHYMAVILTNECQRI